MSLSLSLSLSKCIHIQQRRHASIDAFYRAASELLLAFWERLQGGLLEPSASSRSNFRANILAKYCTPFSGPKPGQKPGQKSGQNSGPTHNKNTGRSTSEIFLNPLYALEVLDF